MTPELMILLLLCALVTYLPRCFPFFLTWMKRLPAPVRKFLSVIPIAALGALLFPGVFLEFPAFPLLGIAGISVSALLAWRFGGLVLPIASSIVTVYIILMFL